ncbi:hypothetical protein C8J57DRAFT_1225886 [Mycena rebaudengoi]|nr:hypothetical protein C8J57DRAFT_1225886 [Mycena rebaudengoi]
MACTRSLSRGASRSPSIPPTRHHHNPTPSQITDEPRVAKTDGHVVPTDARRVTPSPSPSHPPRLECVGRHELHPQERVEFMRSARGSGQRNDCGEGRRHHATQHQTPDTRRGVAIAPSTKRVATARTFRQHKRGAAPTEHEKGEENRHHKPAHLQLRRRPASKCPPPKKSRRKRPARIYPVSCTQTYKGGTSPPPHTHTHAVPTRHPRVLHPMTPPARRREKKTEKEEERK